ncbi:hypothetical protein GGS20DRAFT_314583 [Poronia punctata]|nr:hypothetical protein GGS20DRAFT_314583 [Poronia punctata]
MTKPAKSSLSFLPYLLPSQLVMSRHCFSTRGGPTGDDFSLKASWFIFTFPGAGIGRRKKSLGLRKGEGNKKEGSLGRVAGFLSTTDPLPDNGK